MCGGVAAPAAADDLVLLDLVAAADAAVAEDAGLVIDRDAERRVVAAARRQPAREPRLRRRRPAFAIVSSSQSPLRCCRAHGDGWSAISISTSVSRACDDRPATSVLTFMPGSHSRMQAAA